MAIQGVYIGMSALKKKKVTEFLFWIYKKLPKKETTIANENVKENVIVIAVTTKI